MRFGLALPQFGTEPPGPAPITYEDAAGWAVRAEELGFDSVWLSDHFFYSWGRYGGSTEPIATLEPLTTLAGIAMQTERVRLGTLVLCAPFRHPSVLAKAAVSIDLLSEGRLDLGLGAGWFEDEFDAFGYRFGSIGDRFEALEDTLGVLDALFTGSGAGPGEPASFEGTHVRIDHARLLPAAARSPRIPLWIGGKGGPRLLRLTARYADGWNAVWRWSPDAYVAKVADARAAFEGEGRDPDSLRLSLGLYTLLAEDDAGVEAVFERARATMPGNAMAGETLEGWCADTLTGTPDRIIERIEAFRELGVEEIIISPWILPFVVPDPEQVELFAERVIAPLRARA